MLILRLAKLNYFHLWPGNGHFIKAAIILWRGGEIRFQGIF
jgi:hypothetical protein